MKTKSNEELGPYANVLMDRWFKRTFGWEPAKPLLTLFLQELIPERQIIDLSYGPQEHINPIDEGKDVRVDVECTDKDGSRFVVEMQLDKQGGFYERAVLNSSFAIQQQIKVGETGYEMPTVYFIGVMNFAFHKGGRVLYRYSLQEKESHEKMTDCLQFLFLELPNSESKALTPEASILDNFCYTLRNLSNLKSRPVGLDGEIFDLLFNSAEITNFTPKEQFEYIKDMTTQEDIKRQIAYAASQAKKDESKEIAAKLLQMGSDVAFVAQATGLTPEEILALSANS